MGQEVRNMYTTTLQNFCFRIGEICSRFTLLLGQLFTFQIKPNVKVVKDSQMVYGDLLSGNAPWEEV